MAQHDEHADESGNRFAGHGRPGNASNAPAPLQPEDNAEHDIDAVEEHLKTEADNTLSTSENQSED